MIAIDVYIMYNYICSVFTSYYTPAEGVSYLLREIPRGESSKYDTPEDRAYSNWFIAK